MSARCLRCGAGNEWIEGTAKPDRAAADRRDVAVRELVEAAGEAILSEIPIDSPVFFRLRAAIAAVRSEYTTDKGEPR